MSDNDFELMDDEELAEEGNAGNENAIADAASVRGGALDRRGLLRQRCALARGGWWRPAACVSVCRANELAAVPWGPPAHRSWRR